MAFSRIIEFLRSDTTTYKGKTLTQLQAMNNAQLESAHDVIQWMFPTDIPSSHFVVAPILSDRDIDTMKRDLIIQSAIDMSLVRMLWFYEGGDFWLTPNNHNYKRLTRILRCLWLAGKKHDYVCIQKMLDDVYIDYPDIVGEETYMYWKHANDKEYLTTPHHFVEAKKPAPRDNVYDYFNYI